MRCITTVVFFLNNLFINNFQNYTGYSNTLPGKHLQVFGETPLTQEKVVYGSYTASLKSNSTFEFGVIDTGLTIKQNNIGVNGFNEYRIDWVNNMAHMYINKEKIYHVNTSFSFPSHIKIKTDGVVYVKYIDFFYNKTQDIGTDRIELWKPFTDYFVNDLVNATGIIWKCIQDHVSSQDFRDDRDLWRGPNWTPEKEPKSNPISSGVEWQKKYSPVIITAALILFVAVAALVLLYINKRKTTTQTELPVSQPTTEHNRDYYRPEETEETIREPPPESLTRSPPPRKFPPKVPSPPPRHSISPPPSSLSSRGRY